MEEDKTKILVLAFARLTDTMGNGFFVVLLPAYLASSQFSLQSQIGPLILEQGTLIGICVAIYALVSAGLQRYTGRLSDWARRRRIFVLVGLGIIGCASFLYPLADRYVIVVTLRAIQGLGAALALPASMAIVNEVTDSTDRGGNIGIFNAVRLLGYVIGPTLGGVLLAHGPYRLHITGRSVELSGFDIAFPIAGSLAFVSILLVLTYVPDPDAQYDTGRSDGIGLAVFGRNQFLHPVFALGVATLFMSITVDMFVPLQSAVNARLGQNEAYFSLEYSALIAAVILFLVPVGRASDRFGRRPFLIGGATLLVPVMLVQGFITSIPLMILARFVHGIAMAAAFSPALAFAGDFATDGQSGSYLAVITMAYGFGRALGPLIGGVFGDAGYQLPFVVSGVLSFVALVLIITQVRKPANQTAAVSGTSVPSG